MSTNIHIQIGDRKFDYEGDTPLAREDLLDAITKLIPEADGPTETAEEFGSSLAAPEAKKPSERPYQCLDPLDVFIAAKIYWAQLYGGSNNWGVSVLAGAYLFDAQHPGEPFVQRQLTEAITRYAPGWGKSWPCMYAGRYLRQAIRPGMIEEIGDHGLVLSQAARDEITKRIE